MRARNLCVLVSSLALTSALQAQTGFWNFETPHVSPVCLTPSGNRLLAVNTADGRLEVFDVTGAAGVPVRVKSIPVGLDPVSVRCRGENEAWVINHVSDSISIVDLSSGRVVRTVLTGDEPTDVVFAGVPQRAFVSLSQLNQVRVLDPLNPSAAATILNIQGEEPRQLAVSADGTKVYVAIFESGNGTTAIRQQDVSNATGPYAGVNPPPNVGATFSPARTPGNPPAPPVALIVRKNTLGQWMDDNNRNWSTFVTWNSHDHDVAIIDTASLSVGYVNSLMTTVMGIAVKPDGQVSVVGTEAKNEVRFEPNVKSVFIRAQIATFPGVASATGAIADLNPHLNYAVRSIPQSQRNLSVGDPRGLVWHPSNGRAYVSGMGSNSVIVTDSTGARVATIDVGQGPTGLAMTAGGARVYVLNKFDGSISVVDTATNTESARIGFFDPTPTTIKDGRPLLYSTHTSSGLGQAACASCHIDGRSDFLAWDLGDPSGAVKAFNQDCRQPVCQNWHPMKGPMVTQVFQGIVNNGPMHWRGDREDVTAFAGAFVSLQGADVQPTTPEMNQLQSFVASIRYQPNPNRNFDGTMPGTFPTTGGTTGNPNTGLTLFNTLGVLPGGLTCAGCHTLPRGTDTQIDDPRLPLSPQPLKVAQLRGMNEKLGWRRNSTNNNKGFGFNHQSEFDTLGALLGAGFNFAPGAAGQQQRQDVEAFMLCFDSETHAGVGQQQMFDGTNNNDAASVQRINSFVVLANSGAVSLVAKGRRDGMDRGWVYVGGNNMQSDRNGEVLTVNALRTGATTGGEIVFTLVPTGTQRRIGIDRDADGVLDQDEIDAGSRPDDASSTPACLAVVTQQPLPVVTRYGRPAQFAVGATSVVSYQWRHDGVEVTDTKKIAGSDASVMTIGYVLPEDAGQYNVQMTNACGVRTSATVQLVVQGCQPADIAADDGTPLPTNLILHPNTGVNEGDYNAFFGGFFDAAPESEIADDQGNTTPQAEVANSGVNEGDYNAFFQSFFNGCP